MSEPLRAKHPEVGVPVELAQLEFTFDGEPLHALPGQSIGGALIMAGRRSWRRTRISNRPRGLFCGIGVCFDCLVNINGRPNQRACAIQTEPGDVVTTQEGSGGYDS